MKQFNLTKLSSKARLFLSILFLPTILLSQPPTSMGRNAVGYLPWDIKLSGNFNPDLNLPFDGFDFGPQPFLELDNVLVGVNETGEQAQSASMFLSVHQQSDPVGPFVEIELIQDLTFIPDGVCTSQYRETELNFDILSGLPDSDYFISVYWQAILEDGTTLTDGSPIAPFQALIEVGNGDAPPCIDFFETVGEAIFDFNNQPIPADFFGPGSEPFFGQIPLIGVPIDPLSGSDTRILRLEPIEFPGPGPSTVPIEIVELNLESSQPIVIGDGTPWLVGMGLSDEPQEQGQLQAILDLPNGGAYTTIIPVLPRFVFINGLTSCCS